MFVDDESDHINYTYKVSAQDNFVDIISNLRDL